MPCIIRTSLSQRQFSLLSSDSLGSSKVQQVIPSVSLQRMQWFAIVTPLLLTWLIDRGQQAGWYNHSFGLLLMLLVLSSSTFRVIRWAAAIFHQVNQDLQAAEEWLQLSLEVSGQGIWDWKLDNEILSWDNRCKEIFGLPPDSTVTYQRYLDVLHPTDRQRVCDALAVAQREHKRFDEEYRIVHPDGTIRWVLLRGYNHYDAVGEPYRMLGTVLDITEHKQAQAEIEEQNRLKDEFLASLSHELRTPLNPILGWLNLMKNQKLTPTKIAEALQVVECNVRRQMALIEDLLDVSSIVRGKLKLKFQLMDLVGVLNAAIQTVHFAALAKRITIELHGLSSLQTIGDCDRLQQVFWNLLSNAIKFTPDGGHVKVELLLVTNSNGTDCAQISVTDTGIGVASECLEHVFERFRQCDGSITRKYGGLGLGLALVRHLVELHGGTVAVESPGVDLGSTFTVKLPMQIEVESLTSISADVSVFDGNEVLCEALSESQIMQTACAATTNLTQVRIVLVDDDPDNLELLRFLLEEEGAAVTALTSPLEALKIITNNPPDLIISDIGMPQMNGYELMREIRMLPQTKQTPALALTAFAETQIEQLVLASGFHAYLTKPIDILEFLACVTQLVNSYQLSVISYQSGMMC